MKRLQRRIALLPATAMVLSTILVPGMAFAEEADKAGVVVEANAESNTGYTVSFTYHNEEATNVQIMGGFQFYVENDENLYGGGYNLAEGDSAANYMVAPEDWSKDADLWHAGDAGYIADMVESEDGTWTYTIDLPGGCYLYQYKVSYDDGENYEAVIDPENIPYCNEIGAHQTRSQFYVPYDAEKHSENEDWTWLTPAEKEEDRGTLLQENYPGLDDTERPVEIYLPAHYDAEREEEYKVLYLSHGGGGEEGDWFYQGNAGNIVDRLVAEGNAEEFVMVAMNNSQLEWDYDKIYENMKDYLIPYIEENFNVSKEAEDRAFAGLSMGGMTTSELWYRDPGLFGYFGVFSGASTANFPEVDDYSAYAAPNMYVAAGWEDMALQNSSYQTDSDRTTVGFGDKLTAAGIEYNGGEEIYIVQGGHDWFTWPQIIRHYVETTLWK